MMLPENLVQLVQREEDEVFCSLDNQYAYFTLHHLQSRRKEGIENEEVPNREEEWTEKNIKIWEPPTYTNFLYYWMNNRRFVFFFTTVDLFALTLVWGVQLFNQPSGL